MNTIISNKQGVQRSRLHRRLRLAVGPAIPAKVGGEVIGGYALEVVQLPARAVHINVEVMHLSESHHAYCGMYVLDPVLNKRSRGWRPQRGRGYPNAENCVSGWRGLETSSQIALEPGPPRNTLQRPALAPIPPDYGSQEIAQHHLFSVQPPTLTNPQAD